MTHQEERQRNRHAILLAAEDAFLSRGIDKTTVSEIAQAANLTPMSVYRYFGAKQNIVVAVANRLLKLYLTQHHRLCRATRPQGAETGFEEFSRTLRAYLQVYASHPEYIRFLQDMAFYSARECLAESVDYLGFASPEPGNLSRPGRSALLRGQEDGSVRRDLDLNLVCMNVTNLLTGGVSFRSCLDDRTQFDILRYYAEMIIYFVENRTR